TRPSASARAAREKTSSARSRASRKARDTVSATAGAPLPVAVAVAVPVRGRRRELLDVGVHQRELPLAVERAAHDALRHLHRQLPDLAAKLASRPVPFRLDLLPGALHDPLGLRLGA